MVARWRPARAAEPQAVRRPLAMFIRKRVRGELIVPPETRGDPKAVEIARVWAAHGGQHVSLKPTLWEDPFAWGIVLVDLARHVANALEKLEGKSKRQVLERIREGFDAEWS